MWKRTIFFKQIIEGNSSLRGPNTVTESKCSSFVRSTLNVPEDLHTHSQLRGLSEDFRKSAYPSTAGTSFCIFGAEISHLVAED